MQPVDMASHKKSSKVSVTKPYLCGVYMPQDAELPVGRFPFNLPFVSGLNLDLDRPVTFFVGENGSGKSTLLEAIAELCGFSPTGGSRHDNLRKPEDQSQLAQVIRPKFRQRPRDGFFFRAETLVQFAELLDNRRRDPDFGADPFAAYGGVSLQAQSHGEAFLSVFRNRVGDGLFLIDEPEAALSPARQLALLLLMHGRASSRRTQFIVATHSPVLLTFPEAAIINFDDRALSNVSLEETKHYQITRGILEHPEQYWHRLVSPSGGDEDE